MVGANDWVFREVNIALEHNIPVVPVLIYPARQPVEVDLPLPLKELAFRESITVYNDKQFESSVWTEIDHLLPGPSQEQRLVILAEAGIPFSMLWIPACAGMTINPPELWFDEALVVMQERNASRLELIRTRAQRSFRSVRHLMSFAAELLSGLKIHSIPTFAGIVQRNFRLTNWRTGNKHLSISFTYRRNSNWFLNGKCADANKS